MSVVPLSEDRRRHLLVLLPVSAFTLVMATGVVTIAAGDAGQALVGVAIYPAIAVTVVMRLHGRGWHAADITPDHWILMGAPAIGARILAAWMSGRAVARTVQEAHT